MISIESYRASIGSFNSCQNGSNWARSSSGGIPPMTPEEFTRKKKLHDIWEDVEHCDEGGDQFVND